MSAWPGHVEMVGEVDVSNASLVGSVLDGVTPEDGHVVVDLRALSFIDVTGAEQLVKVARRLRPSSRVRVGGAPPQLRTILQVVGWDDEMDFGGAA